MNTKAIYFDMDGTIANLYAVEGWLEKLRASDPSPYKQAKPMLKMQPLARKLNELQKKGYTLGVISWGSMDASPEYDEAVTSAKKEWLDVHLKSVHFDEVAITKYGTPKSTLAGKPLGILFDDNAEIRKEWKGKTYEPENIMAILRALI